MDDDDDVILVRRFPDSAHNTDRRWTEHTYAAPRGRVEEGRVFWCVDPVVVWERESERNLAEPRNMLWRFMRHYLPTSLLLPDTHSSHQT